MEKTKDPGANPRVVQVVQQRHFAKNVRRVTLPAATLMRAKYSPLRKTFDCLKMELRLDREFCLVIVKGTVVTEGNTIVYLSKFKNLKVWPKFTS